MNQTNEDIYKEFGEKLRELRKMHNITQKELANMLSVTQGAIVKYEDGSRKVPIDKLKEISDIFNVSVESLLGIDENINQTSFIVTDPQKAELHRMWVREFKDITWTDEEIQQMLDFARFLAAKRKRG